VITVLEVSSVIAGPKDAKALSQWAKNGSPPGCARVIGAIVPGGMTAALRACLRGHRESRHNQIWEDLARVLRAPQEFLHPECRRFMEASFETRVYDNVI
jgi:hypothetical protein